MVTNDIESALLELQSLAARILDVGRLLCTPGEVDIFPIDLLAMAVIDRSLSLITGFVTLINEDNYTCAAPLVRLHLDSLLRFSACWIHEDGHQLAMLVLKGERIGKIKDQNGKLMTDSYLAKRLSEEYPWITSVYENTSGWIHLSKKHMFNTVSSVDSQEGVVAYKASSVDTVSKEHIIEAIECMKEITGIICEFLEGWNATKRRKNIINEELL